MGITNFQGLWPELLFYHFVSDDEYCLENVILCSNISLTLNVNGWESSIKSSDKWTNENSQSSGFYDAILSAIKTKKISKLTSNDLK
jgi:putative heme degradation protein